MRIVLKKVLLFITFEFHPKKLSKFGVWWKNSGKLVRNAIWVSRGTFREKTIFVKNIYLFLLIVFGLPANFSRKLFKHGCSNCVLRIQVRSLTKFFFSKKHIFYCFRNFTKKNWDFWQKNVSRVVKTAFYVFRGMVWKNLLFLKRLNFLNAVVQWPEKFWLSGKKTSAGLSKLHFMCSEEWFEDF